MFCIFFLLTRVLAVGHPIPIDSSVGTVDVEQAVSAEQPENVVAPTSDLHNRIGHNAATSFWDRIAFAIAYAGRLESQIDDDPSDPKGPSAVTPELEEILEKWQSASGNLKTVRIRFDRHVYNMVTEIEKTSEGELLFNAPDQIRLNFNPQIQKSLMASRIRRLNGNGQPFRIEPDISATWILNSTEVLATNEEKKTFERVVIPLKDTTASANLCCARRVGRVLRSAFMLDINTERIRKQWSLISVKHKETSIVIVARPRTAALQRSLNECWVMIDGQTWQTKAIKLFDPTSSLETVYVVTERDSNLPLSDNCFKPDLAGMGYKEVIRHIGQ